MTFKREEPVTIFVGATLDDPQGRARFYQDGTESNGLALGASGIDIHIRVEGRAANKLIGYLNDKELLALNLITTPKPPEATVANPQGEPHAG